MRENAAAAAMLTPVDKAEQRIGDDGSRGKPAGKPFTAAVRKRIKVARGLRTWQEVAHQHEER